MDVASNPLLSQQQAQQPSQTSSSTEIMSPLLKMAAKKQSDVTPHPPTQPPPLRTSKPAPPKGPPPPHVLLKRKLEKMQAPQRAKGGEMEEEREKDDWMIAMTSLDRSYCTTGALKHHSLLTELLLSFKDSELDKTIRKIRLAVLLRMIAVTS